MTTVRLLLVEDDPADASVVEARLSEAPDVAYDVAHVTSLGAARDYLAQAEVDLALLDLGLPESEGLDSLKQLLGVRPAFPVVVITGNADKELALQCIEEGAQDFIRKDDLRSRELGRSVGYALSRFHQSRSHELERLLESFRELSSAGSATSVTRSLSGVGSIVDAHPEEFELLSATYGETLQEYLDRLVYGKRKPHDAMHGIVSQVGAFSGGPRDLLDIHLRALETLVVRHPRAKADTLATEGRLFALEMMGLLVEFYRVGTRRTFPKQPRRDDS